MQRILDSLGNIGYKCANIQNFPKPYKYIIDLYSLKIEAVFKVLDRKKLKNKKILRLPAKNSLNTRHSTHQKSIAGYAKNAVIKIFLHHYFVKNVVRTNDFRKF